MNEGKETIPQPSSPTPENGGSIESKPNNTNPDETSGEQNPPSTSSEKGREASENKETNLTNQALINFLEQQKYQAKEGKSLSLDQQKFNEKVEELIEQLKKVSDQTITPKTLIQALNLGYQRNMPEQIEIIESEINKAQEEKNKPQTSEEQKKELQQKIDILTQMKEKKEELLKNESQLPEEIKKHVETVFGGLPDNPELKQQLIEALNKGDFDQVIQVFVEEGLKDNENDPQNIKKNKAKARMVAKWVKEKAPIIGGVAALLLLLMVINASKSAEGRQGGMIG